MELKIKEAEYLNVSELDYAPWNYKYNEDEKMDKFANSMEKNGFLYGLIVAQRAESPEDKTWEVIDGNHRLKVLKNKNIEKIPVYKVGRISLEDRIRMSLELNLWKFDEDKAKISECFKKISCFEVDDLASTLPFTSEEIKLFEKLNEINFDMKSKEGEGEEEKQGALKLTFTQAQYNEILTVYNSFKGVDDFTDIENEKDFIIKLCNKKFNEKEKKND